MNIDIRHNKWIMVAAGGVILAIVGIFIFAFTRPSQPTVAPPPGTEVPDYFLAADEEENLKVFVKTFVELYNTYSQDDLSNPVALGDYQTKDMQERTLSMVDNMEQALPVGYEKYTNADVATFSYTYPSRDALFASMQADVRETDVGNYRIEATLRIIKDGKRFYVDSLEIKNK